MSKVDRGYLLPAVIDPPRIGVCVPVPDDPGHRRAFLGALRELTRPDSWQYTDDHQGMQASRVWLEIFLEVADKLGLVMCDDESEVEVNCRSYTADAGFIQYFPNDPRYTPDYIPDGYIAPPWHYADQFEVNAFGAVIGDVITTINQIPVGSLPGIIPAAGFPRVRVNVQGAGVVRLYCRNLIAGSLLQVTLDDDLFSVRFEDLNKDVISVPPETGDVVIIETVIPDAGHHHIDYIVVSKVNDEIPYIYHGGALFAVELCGSVPDEEMTALPLTMDCENGVISLKYDGITIDTVNIADCLPAGGWSPPVPPPDVVGATPEVALKSLLTALGVEGLVNDLTTFQSGILTLGIEDGNILLLRDGDVISSADLRLILLETAANYLTISRNDGSTEAANPLLKLRNDMASSPGINTALDFEAALDDQSPALIATLIASFYDNAVGQQHPHIRLTLADAIGEDQPWQADLNSGVPRIGFLGTGPHEQVALPLDTDLTGRTASLEQALIVFGLAHYTPCSPPVGGWALVWQGEQLFDVNSIGCGIEGLQGVLLETGCPTPALNTCDLNVYWSASNDYHITKVRFTVGYVSQIAPSTGFNWHIYKNPGVSTVTLDSGVVDASLSEYVFEWTGNVDLGSVGIALSTPDLDGQAILTGLRIEGTGERPSAEGGYVCGDTL